MANSWVTKAAITTDATAGTQITLTVQIDDFTAGETVEISGQATQEGGAFANYYSLKQVPVADPTNGDHKIVTVTTHPIPPNQFVPDKEVTTVLRVSMVWATVLQKPSATSLSGGNPEWGPPAVKASLDGNVSNWP
jgi:hypothetical protein